MLDPQNNNDNNDNNDKSVTIITSDKGLVFLNCYFLHYQRLVLQLFFCSEKQKLGIKLKNRHRSVSTLLRYDEQKEAVIV